MIYSTVAMVDNYEPIPTTVEKEPNSFIISELGTAFRDAAGLELSESYRPPEININLLLITILRGSSLTQTTIK